jgi:hypothetical protein
MLTTSYNIDIQGFFKSMGKRDHIIVEVEDNYIPYSGDNLLYVYCTRGTIHVEIDGSEPIIYHGMPTVRFFEGGLPMAGQYAGKVWVRKSSSDAQIYAVFENYPEEDRRALSYYSSIYDQNRGVKLRDPREGAVYQVVGRNRGTPMLERLNGD